MIKTEDLPLCPNCGVFMYPVYFTDREYDSHGFPTGRERTAVSHLVCEICGKIEIVDGSFDSPWRYTHFPH